MKEVPNKSPGSGKKGVKKGAGGMPPEPVDDDAKKARKEETNMMGDIGRTKQNLSKAVGVAYDLQAVIAKDVKWAWANNDVNMQGITKAGAMQPSICHNTALEPCNHPYVTTQNLSHMSQHRT